MRGRLALFEIVGLFGANQCLPISSTIKNSAPKQERGLSLKICDDSRRVSVGVETRTRIGCRRLAPAGCRKCQRTLAGAPSWPLWPGAVRHVQRATVKALPTCLRAGFDPPAARAAS
jgi:hypothetical protein